MSALPSAPSQKANPLVVIAIAAAALLVLYLLYTSMNGGASVGSGGVTPGVSDATTQALLSAQTSFDTNASQVAIAKSADAVTALQAYTSATDSLQATIAQIRGTTQQAQIGATSADAIASTQANASVAIAGAQTQAAIASDNASVGVAQIAGNSAVGVATATGQAAVGVAQAGGAAATAVASQQAQAQTNIANAQEQASNTKSNDSLFGSIFSGIAGIFGL